MSGVVVGKGFRFGYKASGDTESLLTLGAQCGLSVSVVDLVHGDAQHGNEKVAHAYFSIAHDVLLDPYMHLYLRHQ